MRFIAQYSPQARISHQMEFCVDTGAKLFECFCYK
jgi:hypothetical protein